jgi:S-DNA-T family DNA segregation ATPase FtsK/SpoIIIE
MKTGKSTARARRSQRETHPATWDERLAPLLQAWWVEIAGVILLLAGVFTLAALFDRITLDVDIVNSWTHALRAAFGWGAPVVALALMAAGVILLARRLSWGQPPNWARLVAAEGAFLSALSLLYLFAPSDTVEARFIAPLPNGAPGAVGSAIAVLLVEALGQVIAALLLLATLGVSLGATLGLRRADVARILHNVVGGVQSAIASLRRNLATARSEAPRPTALRAARRTPTAPPRPVVPSGELKVVQATTSPRKGGNGTDPKARPRTERAGRKPAARDERLPPLDLLESTSEVVVSEAEIRRKAQLIEETLGHFGLPVRVVEVRQGPAVTQFGLEPGYIERTGPDGELRRTKVRVSQIVTLSNDLALALAAPRLRIEAPVPGRGVVGVEVPNVKVGLVGLRAAMESDRFQRHSAPLVVALGRDVSGAVVVADLEKMPHVLIAGTTGSGKSVCISAVVTCLACTNTPDDLRLVLIDPKRVELTRFNGLPHLLGKVEVELDRILGVLQWLTREMDERYKTFADAGARNLADYNAHAGKLAGRLPRIVVIIDELADLMMSAPDQTEPMLCRLAQMARATGIHLVVATQRPSTDVVTGLIKANFPARIAFAVASLIDSRVILDTPGAETLLGRGDMLFQAPEASTSVRLQGCFVSDAEIERVVDYWRLQATRTGWEREPEAPWEQVLREREQGLDSDELLERAITLVRQTGSASASLLQRRLRIGYPRAARLMDELEALGLVGGSERGNRTRRVYDEDNEEE